MTDTATIDVTLRVEEEWAYKVDELIAAYHAEIEAALTECAFYVSEQIKDVILTRDIHNTGNLYNSITFTPAELVGDVYEAMVGTAVEYARYQEFGTRPHFVPFHIAEDLYHQAKHEWGWKEPGAKQAARLDPSRKWLVRPGAKKPTWGVFVTGQAQPFIYPGFEASLDWMEKRILQIPDAVAARMEAS